MKKSCFKGCFCSKAFTLIELLVVVLIIGILAAVAVPQYQKAVLKARATQLFTFAKHFRDVCTIDLLAGGTCAKWQDMGFEYTIDNYTYDEESGLEAGSVSGFPIDHDEKYFTAYDTQSNLCIHADAKGIYCVALEHDAKIEKICEAMGGKRSLSHDAYSPNSFYRLD